MRGQKIGLKEIASNLLASTGACRLPLTDEAVPCLVRRKFRHDDGSDWSPSTVGQQVPVVLCSVFRPELSIVSLITLVAYGRCGIKFCKTWLAVRKRPSGVTQK